MANEMTRDEYLAWCRDRALEYLNGGNLVLAFASMVNDLTKHGEAGLLLTRGKLNKGASLAMGGDTDGVRRWIEDF